MLPRDRGKQILADHAAGKPVREIARAYGHSPATVRDYAPRAPDPRSSPQPGPTTLRRSPATAGSGWPTTLT